MVEITSLGVKEWSHQARRRPANILKIEDNRPESRSFTTWYRPENPVLKTVAYFAEEEGADGKPVSGKLEVHMRSGEVYSFESWASCRCGGFGINVSDDGERIYIISDISGKGLRCYTKEGALVWKTRFTSVTDVLVHPDSSVTALTYSGNVYKIDGEGNITAKRKGFDGRAPSIMSDKIISLCTGDYTLAFFDSFCLEPICKVPFRNLPLEHINCEAISEKYVVLVGSEGGKTELLPSGGRIRERLPVIYLLERKMCAVLRKYDREFIRENGISEKEEGPVAAYAALQDEKIVLFQGGTLNRIEIPIL